MHYLLFYEVGEDYVSRRAEFRDAHLEKAWQASARGELVLGGALSNPVDGAVLLFKGDSPEVAEKFARADPYVTSGAVKRWHVREWIRSRLREKTLRPPSGRVQVIDRTRRWPAPCGSTAKGGYQYFRR
ncbi:MAG TPA: YciI-like protein [Terriglobales bacterium]|nr:YciI-like protein [Terriglobales bacterium]